ncbi:MAG: phosphatidylglycerophosphatase A [Phycisphaerales bacterium]|nr:phosphatidylglycerophosphatase A [Phycisphaerales bacterium]
MMRGEGLNWITVWGLGHLRPASGTWGSLPAWLAAAALVAAGISPAEHAWVYRGVMLLVLVVFSAACIVQGDRAEARFNKKDPGQVVADEMAGMALTLVMLPAAGMTGGGRAVFTLIYAFLAFRIMDIVKPWPAGAVQRVPGGWGILLDDLIAGLYAGLLIVMLVWARLPGAGAG